MPTTYSGMTLDQLRASGRYVDPSSHNTTDEQNQAIYDVNPQWMSSFEGLPSYLNQMSADYYNGQSDPNYSGVRPDAAFSQGLIEGGYKPREAIAPDGKSIWRWIEDAQGNVVVQPQQINNEDPAFAAAAAAAIAAVTAGTINAGFGVSGAPGASAGAGAAGGVPGAGAVAPTAPVPTVPTAPVASVTPGPTAPFSLGGPAAPGFSIPVDPFGIGGSVVPTAGEYGALTGLAGDTAAAGLVGVQGPLTAAPGSGLFTTPGIPALPGSPTAPTAPPAAPPAAPPTTPPATPPAAVPPVDPLSTGSSLADKIITTGIGTAIGAGVGAMGPPAPPPPNPLDLINAQTAANSTAAQESTALARPDVTNPFGSSKWVRVEDATVPGGFRWENTIAFSPEQQGLYDTTVSNQQSLLDTSSDLLGRIDSNYATPFDLASYGPAQTVDSNPDNFNTQRDEVQAALYERLMRARQPQMERDKSQMDSTLRNQGLTPGSEAYDNAMRGLLEAQSGEIQDYNSRSVEAGGIEQTRLNTDNRANVGFNNTVRTNNINEGLTQRNMPLSEYNALTNGTQPTLPTFQPYGTGAVTPTNVSGIQQQAYSNAQDTYNARMAQYQSILNFGTAIGG